MFAMRAGWAATRGYIHDLPRCMVKCASHFGTLVASELHHWGPVLPSSQSNIKTLSVPDMLYSATLDKSKSGSTLLFPFLHESRDQFLRPTCLVGPGARCNVFSLFYLGEFL